MMENKEIIALTTDPYGNIFGYSLVFMKLFDFIQKNNPDLGVVLLVNDGVCSKIVNNKNFITITLNPKANPVTKAAFLAYSFIRKVMPYDKNAVIVANAEIPELLAAYLLKIKFNDVYCVVHDAHVRDKVLVQKIINALRLFLLKRINNVIFINRNVMEKASPSLNKFYIGSPVFW